MTMPAYDASLARTQLWNVTPPELESNSYPANNTRRQRGEFLDDVSLRRTQSFPCVSSQQQIGGDTANELYYVDADADVDVDCSCPREMLGDVSAPSYASNLSGPHRSCVLLWADRSNGYDMPSENLDEMTPPNMFNSTRGDDYTAANSNSNSNANSNSKRGRSRGMPEQRQNFARSTANGEDNAAAGNGGTVGDFNDPPCQCPASQMSVKSLNNSNSQMRQNASDKQSPYAGKSTSQQNHPMEGDARGAVGKKEVTIVEAAGPNNDDCDYENINDISMPDLQGSQNASEPTYGPSLPASSYSNISCNPRPNQQVGYNYAPPAQMSAAASGRSGGQLATPQPLRGAQQSSGQKCVGGSRARCCCSNNCRRYRKSRQIAKNRNASGDDSKRE
ncbi:hypothetical protein KR093_010832 [Drosophila rubida]|uniref:Uncharacterized protein n=1 Tax=Drosophila rubida TaxID=30044 RepID=A0AAD4KCC8_9MUSC|nr:hypothetical protein KR093_010832 [Drosophila rubida]